MDQKWDAEKALEKWMGRNRFSDSKKNPSVNSNLIHFYGENEYIPISELESVVLKAANIVNQLGPDYLDIFERAERELENAKQNMNTLERINRIALSGSQSCSYIKSDLVQPKSFLLQAWASAVSGANVFMSH